MPANPSLPPVIELRQYSLHPGRRDELIELFEREFIESQEACGMRLLGQFRDLDHADRFVWMRGFAGMPERAQALASFYGGPVWQAHRDAANATMIDSDDVLLLKPSVDLTLNLNDRNPGGDLLESDDELLLTICPLRELADDSLRERWTTQVLPLLRSRGARLLACLETEPAPNTFPRLPVREGERVLVWLSSMPGEQTAVQMQAFALLEPWLCAQPQTLRLRATPRSAWR